MSLLWFNNVIFCEVILATSRVPCPPIKYAMKKKKLLFFVFVLQARLTVLLVYLLISNICIFYPELTNQHMLD